MAAWGIEDMGADRYKVLKFQYRWQLKDWVAQKPESRHAAKQTDSLDRHLTVKAMRSSKNQYLDTRRVKV